jgi:phosphonate transport system substrate-binding protein
MKKTTVAFLLACSSLIWTPPTFASNSETLTLNYGVISSKAKKRIKDSYPLFSYVAKQLNHLGYTDAKINVYPTIDELVSALQQGEVDIVSSTIYPALIVKRRAQAEPFLVRWKKGEESYNSVFVTHKKNEYNDLSQLQGKVIGFEDRASTSGYFLPMVTLLSHGLEVQQLTSLQSKPDADKVGYFFFDDMLRETNEVNMTMWTAKGMVDAIAYSSSNWNNPKDTPAALKQQLHTFAHTNDYPRSIMSISHLLDPVVATQLKAILLELDQSPIGLEVLESYQETKKFSVLNNQANDLLYEAEQLLTKFDAHQ